MPAAQNTAPSHSHCKTSPHSPLISNHHTPTPEPSSHPTEERLLLCIDCLKSPNVNTTFQPSFYPHFLNSKMLNLPRTVFYEYK